MVINIKTIIEIFCLKQELLNKPSYDFYHPEDVESVKSNFLQAANMKGQVSHSINTHSLCINK